MLAESVVRQKWRELFRGGHVSSESLDAAEELIDRLPYSSPLRFHLGRELNELRAKQPKEKKK